MSTLLERLEDHARTRPDQLLVHHQGRDWSYGEILAHVQRLTVWFQRQGLEPGERIAIVVNNSAEYIISYLAALRANAIAVPLNTGSSAQEFQVTLTNCQPAFLIAGPEAREALAEVLPNLPQLRAVLQTSTFQPFPLACRQLEFAQCLQGRARDREFGSVPQPSALAQLIYTSGTSGQPKGVALTHRNLQANTDSIVAYLQLQASDRALVILPFYYSYGNSLLLTHLAVGGSLILASDFVFWNRVLDLMERQRATGLAGVPSTFAMFLHRSDFAKRAFPALRYLTCAGGALAPAHVAQLRAHLPHTKLFLMYGQTEATARLSTLLPDDLDRKPGSIGHGIPGVQLQLYHEHGRPAAPGETGEIVARGDNLMAGYWNDPRSTAHTLRAEGLRTGDLARRDEEGYLYIVGRKSDLIKNGSYRIHPQEIEQVLLELNEIAEVAVCGQPDPLLGEVAVAYLVPRTSESEISEQAVLEHCRLRLPRHKQIRRAYVVAQLPKTSSGKIRRAALSTLWQAA